jgi:alpha-tubulin suppressor-like RCC1 family protein
MMDILNLIDISSLLSMPMAIGIIGARSTNKFNEKVLVNKTVDDNIGQLQTNGYATSWTPPLGDISSKYCTTEFINSNFGTSVTFSTVDPINPDLNPEAHTWVKVSDTYPRNIVDVYFWDANTSKWDTYEVISYISASSTHAVLLMENGSVKTSGMNTSGQLLTLNTIDSSTFKLVDKVNLKKVCVGEGFTLFVKSDNTTWLAGSCTNIQNGGEYQLLGFENPSKIACGGSHIVIEKYDGTVWVGGWNGYGQYGLGDTIDRNGFTQIPNISYPNKIVCGYQNTVIEKSDGTLWGAGWNYQGQLLPYYSPYVLTYTNIFSGVTFPVKIAIGDTMSLVQKSDGTLWASGSNTPISDGSYKPLEQIPNIINPINFSCGATYIMIEKSDGTVWAYGNNDLGSIGINGNIAYYDTLTQIPNVNFPDILLCVYFSTFISNKNLLRVAGYDNKGQLGLGYSAPVLTNVF